MAVQSNICRRKTRVTTHLQYTAFSLHRIMLDKIASIQPTLVEAHPDTAVTGHFLPLGYKGKILPNEEIEVICANGATVNSVATQE
jgi:hypothetical protein